MDSIKRKSSLVFFLSLLLSTSVLAHSVSHATDLTHQYLYGRFNDSSCTGSGKTTICTAVGFSSYLKGVVLNPLLVQSTDEGRTYKIVLKDIPEGGSLLTTTCVGKNKNALCLAGGYEGYIKEKSRPLLIQSSDGATTWKINPVPGLTGGLFKKFSCASDDPDALCVGIGWNPHGKADGGRTAIIVQSKDRANTWKVPAVNHFPEGGLLKSVSCNGTKKSAICVAVGYDDDHHQPFITQTTDGGQEWKVIKFSFKLDSSASFEDVSCAGAGTKTTCSVVGYVGEETARLPLVVTTHNGGTTWKKQFLQDLPSEFQGSLSSVKCTRIHNTPICNAVGIKYYWETNGSYFSYPLLAQTYDKAPWLVRKIDNDNNYVAESYKMDCTQDNSLCVTSGNTTVLYHPIIIQSQDGGSSWNLQGIIKDAPDSLPNGFLRTASCSGKGTTAMCITVGYKSEYLFDDVPIIIQTTNGGSTWEKIPLYSSGINN